MFSFKEEALAYLRLGAPQGRWRAREVGAEELASMLLLGPCSRFGWVALDPMPEISARAVVRLLSTSRESFLDFLKDLLMDEPENTHPPATWYLPDGTRSFLDGRRRSDGRRP